MCKSNNYVQFHSYTGYTALQWFKSHLEWKKKVLLKNPYFFFFMCKAIFYKQSYLSLQLFEKLHLTNV